MVVLRITFRIPEILSKLPVRRSVDHQLNISQISAKNASI